MFQVTKYCCRPIFDRTKQTLNALPQLKAGDALLISPPDGFESFKCNTPDPQRKNIFEMAKTTVDKVKYNVKMKRKEWINMVYNPHEGSSEEEDVVDK